MCFAWISEQTAIISLYSTNLSVFIIIIIIIITIIIFIYLLQLGCHPVAAVILHVYKT